MKNGTAGETKVDQAGVNEVQLTDGELAFLRDINTSIVALQNQAQGALNMKLRALGLVGNWDLDDRSGKLTRRNG